MPPRIARVPEEKLHRIVKLLAMHRRHHTKPPPDRASVVRRFADILAMPGVDVNALISGAQTTLFGELITMIAQHANHMVGPMDDRRSSLLECAHLLAKHAGTDVNCTTSSNTKYPYGTNSVLDSLIRYVRRNRVVDPLVQRILTAIVARPELIVGSSQILLTLYHKLGDDTILSLIDHPSMTHATIESDVLTQAVVRGRDRVVRRLLCHSGLRFPVNISPLENAVRLCEWHGTTARLRILRALVEDDRCAVQELRIRAQGANICEDLFKILLKSDRFDMHKIRTHN